MSAQTRVKRKLMLLILLTVGKILHRDKLEINRSFVNEVVQYIKRVSYIWLKLYAVVYLSFNVRNVIHLWIGIGITLKLSLCVCVRSCV